MNCLGCKSLHLIHLSTNPPEFSTFCYVRCGPNDEEHKIDSRKCPCSICLIKSMCVEMCEDLINLENGHLIKK